jgi:hypothetical protein
MYKTAETWKELHPAKAGLMELEECPEHLAKLPEDPRMLQPGQVGQFGPVPPGVADLPAAPPGGGVPAVASAEGGEGKKKKKRNNKKKKKAGGAGVDGEGEGDGEGVGVSVTLDAGTIVLAAGVTLAVSLLAVYLLRRR